MKNTMRCVGITALVAVIGFSIIALSFTGCDDGGGGDTRDPVTYTGTANGVTYTLRIEAGGSRAVLTPAQGDQYTLTANSKQSTGKVTKVVGGVLTLAPKEDPDEEFTTTVSGNGISAMSGTITWDDSTTAAAPTTFTPPVTNPGTGWNWTAVADTTFDYSYINGIAYGGGKWVAVGAVGKIAYSSDGVSWTAVTDKSAWELPSVIYVGSTYQVAVNAVAYGGGKFVAVGDSGTMAYSSDGVTWTAVTDKTIWSKGGSEYRSITSIVYGGGKWVAGCKDGYSSSAEVERMAYSDDGISWTKVTDFNGYSGHCSINDIAYGAGKFVIVSSDYTIAYSNDGVSWTITEVNFGTRSSLDHIYSVAYGGGKFVAGGWQGKIAYSADGINWTNVADSSFDSVLGSHIEAMAYGGGRFVAGASGSRMAYSNDGINWTRADSAVWEYTSQTGYTSEYGIEAIAYGGGKFVAVGYRPSLPGRIAYCEWGEGGSGNGGNTRDPATYTGAANGVTYTLRIEAGTSRAVLTPTQGDQYTLTQTANTKQSTGKVTKVVGGVLTLEPSADPDDTFTATVSGNNITAMTGGITWDDGTANIAPTTLTPSVTNPNPGTDGPTNWTYVANHPFGSSEIAGIAYGNNRWVAVNNTPRIAYSDDNGVTWTTAVTTGIFSSGWSTFAIAYGNGKFVAGTGSDHMGYSTDGETWIKIDNSVSFQQLKAIAYGNNRFVAVGRSGRMAYSTDGITWTTVANSTFGSTDIEGIAYGNNKWVAVGGLDTNGGGKMAYSTDNGVTWTAVANTTFDSDDSIYAIAYGSVGNAGGRFVAVGENQVGSIYDNTGKMAYSDDGISWTAVTILGDFYPYIYGIAYGNNRFVADMCYSTNGITWTVSYNIPSIRCIAYGNGRFVVGCRISGMEYADW